MAACPASPDHLWPLLGWWPGSDELGQFSELQQELRQWNQRLNLTRLVEGDDFWIGQVFDSLWPLKSMLGRPADSLTIVDVGTGGGFPGLAVAIALPGAHLTLVDSVGRKVEAVRAMATALGLEGRVSLRCERIERSGQLPACRGRFDWALARAVASAPVVAEYLVPLLKPTGRALLYRGQWTQADEQALEAALHSLKARLVDVQRCDLPAGRGVRHALTLEVVAPCPKAYPRPVGQPAKQPLGGSG